MLPAMSAHAAPEAAPGAAPAAPPHFSPDQAAAWRRCAALLQGAGIDLGGGKAAPRASDAPALLAVLGKAGSGKTLLLAELARAARAAGLRIVTGDWEGRRRDRRSLAVLAPTNKAASVLRLRGVPATTIHRILYTPVYDPQFEALAEWLAGEGERPPAGALSEAALDRAAAFHATTPSVPGALAAAGLRGSDFITGWKRREAPLDVGLVDEASMLGPREIDDLREIFPTLVLFGDPAQLAPVGRAGAEGDMAVRALPEARVARLSRVHRQESGSPILDLAHALGDEGLGFEDFERMVHEAAGRDRRVVVAGRVDAALMARSPCLVWTQRHAHPPHPCLPRGLRRAPRRAPARRALNLRRHRAAAEAPPAAARP